MPELTTKERLQPSLLDRLSDDEPARAQESRDQRVLSPQRLRETVLRDLGWLLNSAHLESTIELGDFPEAAQSVINYGLPDLTGKSVSTIDTAALAAAIRKAIWEFEPRLLKRSVRVQVVANSATHNTMRFTIDAQLWAQPMPLQLFLQTSIDLETGEAVVHEATRAP
jgi:type VI secretion system protein ImpF